MTINFENEFDEDLEELLGFPYQEVAREVIAKVLGFAEENDFGFLGLDFSPIRGPEGNIEYLLYLKAGREGVYPAPDIPAVVAAAHAELEG